MRKLSRKGAIAKLDGLCRDIVWIRDNSTCQKCGRKVDRDLRRDGNVHHIVPKKRGYHVRWELNNLILLCSGCHFWWHSDPFSLDWLREEYPHIADVVSEINRYQTNDYKQRDLLELISALEKFLYWARLKRE